MSLPKKAACVGAGLIGAGWAARLALQGVDVTLYDPNPQAPRMMDDVLRNAERAWGLMTMAPLPPRGRIAFAPTLAEAVAGADFIQESSPERLDLKRRIINEIDAAASPSAIIGSSTSGLMPSDLQAEMRHPERFLVGHPYNPVYLLPIVELVGGAKTTRATIERARGLYDALGMKPVVIDKEIPAFVGDRLLEALWREALWLIKDDICTVETLDDVMRYGFGLRWAQMGLFQTYRIAGGEAGMRHFMAQFGPCLHWPWTKFTDVPELDDALVDKIADQSDAQAKGLGIRELERIRDENLVGILQALKGGHGGRGWGAGLMLKSIEERLWAGAKGDAPADPAKPLRIHEGVVNPGWIDYNGHMTEFRYLQVFGDATDAVLRLVGVDAEAAAKVGSYYTAESHIRHLREIKQGARFVIETQILGAEGKKLHLFHKMLGADGTLHATGEHMMIYVADGKSATPGPDLAARIAVYAEAHKGLPSPEGAGRGVGARKA